MVTADTRSLDELHADFRAGSTNAMPLAGALCWAALGIAALVLPPHVVGTLALYMMAAILPLAFGIDRLRGRNLFGGSDNPLNRLFFHSIVGIALVVPIAVIAAGLSRDPTILVLGMAILAGVIWIPYGWAAADPVGLRHAVARGLGCYAAYALAPEPLRASAICAVVVLAYAYSLRFMRPTGPVPTPTAA